MTDEKLPPTDGQTSDDNLRQIVDEATAPITDADVSRPRLIAQFVIFPVAIIVVGLGIYFLLGLLTSEKQTARDYLDTIRIGGINSRWQAAYELPKVLEEEQRQGRLSPAFVDELIRVFEGARHDDVRVRRYLALALGRVQSSKTVPVLIDAMKDPDDETRIYAMLSLGAQGDVRAVSPLIEMASSEDSGMRKTAVYALGQIEDPRTRPVLLAALRDRTPDVRWNAALQLARSGDDAGIAVLGEMLNRTFLDTVEGLNAEQRREVMIQAIRAVGVLEARALSPTLQALRAEDPDLKVRQAAIEILDVWGEK